MPTKFDDYLREIEKKIKAEGPEAVARWEAFNTHFAMAHEVRELRKERHLTQKQLAAASGISQAEISHIERGQTNPTASTLAALLAPLGARLGVLKREGGDESECGCADNEVEAVAAERIRSGATQRTRDGETALAELGIDVCRGLDPKRGVPSSRC
ncbi:MAG: helix-turn-helix transcriptional regulator [Solirubrobacteraceae bacterium]